MINLFIYLNLTIVNNQINVYFFLKIRILSYLQSLYTE